MNDEVSEFMIKVAIILFYIGNEGISIIENADKLGVPIPKLWTRTESLRACQ